MATATRGILGVVVLGLWGCNKPEPAPADTDTDTTVGTNTTTTSPNTTDSPTETADTAPVGEPYDCAAIPPTVVGVTQLNAPRGYHDVAFDLDGNLIGSSTSNTEILKVTHDDQVQVFVPGAGMVQQMVWLPDGDLAVASDVRGIVRVAPNGGSSIINGDVRPYGLILGPDEMLYAANQEVVYRVDPISGDKEVLIPDSLQNGTARVINFNLDYTKLYIGTFFGNGGKIYSVDLDANLDPIAPPEIFVSGVGTGNYHDSLGIDLCGYLYVADYSTSAMYRISPDGSTVQTLLQDGGLFSSNYGHGMEWGNGIGNWREDAIYLPQPYNQNKVAEVVIGVPSRHWDKGYAINLPPQ